MNLEASVWPLPPGAASARAAGAALEPPSVTQNAHGGRGCASGREKCPWTPPALVRDPSVRIAQHLPTSPVAIFVRAKALAGAGVGMRCICTAMGCHHFASGSWTASLEGPDYKQ